MPDLNSVPPSPHALAASRRASSHQMPPPPAPSSSSSINILPSNQSAVNQASSSTSLPSPPLPLSGAMSGPVPGDNTGVGPGPGPLRHPRPMTAADLHSQLEKEQEAVVNRLTRELSLLRAAQNASVVSNTSSTSASGTEPIVSDPQHLLSGSGFSIPSTGRRHHRSSSNTSTRSLTAATAGSSTVGGPITSVVGISAPAPVRPTPATIGGISLSRQNSTASRRSRANSPGPLPLSQPHSFSQSLLNDPAMAGYFHQRAAPHHGPSATAAGGEQLSPGLLPATSRYEETAFYRGELETVKRENEALKRRVRELERMVRERRASDASRGRSESVSTTTSAAASTTGAAAGSGPGGGVSSIAGRRDRERERDRVVSMLSAAGSVGVGVPEEEVRVGESAAGGGLREEEGSQGAP